VQDEMTGDRLFTLLLCHKTSGWDWSPLPFFSHPGAVSLYMSSLPKGPLTEVASCPVPAVTFPCLTPQHSLISDACSLAPAQWLRWNSCSPEDFY